MGAEGKGGFGDDSGMRWKVGWKVMSLTKGDFRGFKRRRKDDGFKTSLSKATFNYNLTHIFCCVDFLFDSCCLVVPSTRRRGRFGHFIHLCCLTSRCL